MFYIISDDVLIVVVRYMQFLFLSTIICIVGLIVILIDYFGLRYEFVTVEMVVD